MRALPALCLLGLLAGCSSIPPGQPPIPLGSGAGSVGYRVCLGPVPVSADESARKEDVNY